MHRYRAESVRRKAEARPIKKEALWQKESALESTRVASVVVRVARSGSPWADSPKCRLVDPGATVQGHLLLPVHPRIRATKPAVHSSKIQHSARPSGNSLPWHKPHGNTPKPTHSALLKCARLASYCRNV